MLLFLGLIALLRIPNSLGLLPICYCLSCEKEWILFRLALLHLQGL